MPSETKPEKEPVGNRCKICGGPSTVYRTDGTEYREGGTVSVVYCRCKTDPKHTFKRVRTVIFS